jgi:pimeloyl-ACP methyl ester carboxylesterase
VAFVKIHNAAHIPTLEQPAATSAALRQWMVQK